MKIEIKGDFFFVGSFEFYEKETEEIFFPDFFEFMKKEMRRKIPNKKNIF